jgi:hypothetical protein
VPPLLLVIAPGWCSNPPGLRAGFGGNSRRGGAISAGSCWRNRGGEAAWHGFLGQDWFSCARDSFAPRDGPGSRELAVGRGWLAGGGSLAERAGWDSAMLVAVALRPAEGQGRLFLFFFFFALRGHGRPRDALQPMASCTSWRLAR